MAVVLRDMAMANSDQLVLRHHRADNVALLTCRHLVSLQHETDLACRLTLFSHAPASLSPEMN